MKVVKVLTVALVVLGMSLVAHSSGTARTATVLDMDGRVSVLSADGLSIPAEIGMQLGQGDAIITGDGAFALVRLEGAETATLDISENSRLMLSELMFDEAEDSQITLLDLALGKVLIRADKLRNERSRFEVKTPTSVVGVRGTTFEVQVEGIE